MKSKHTPPTVSEQDACEDCPQNNPPPVGAFDIKDIQYKEVLIATGTTVFIYDIKTKTYQVDLLPEQTTDSKFAGHSLGEGLISQNIVYAEDVAKIQTSIDAIAAGLSKREVHTMKIRNKKGFDRWFRIQMISIDDFNPKPSKLLMILNDVHNQVLTSQVRYHAERDPLTGLYNRESFFKEAAEIINAHAPGTYVMACFDVSNFKVINDQYGIATGDSVLKNIADIFREGFHPVGGICCRVMADNFAILYPVEFTDSPELEAIRQKITDHKTFELPISFSIGRYIVNDLSLSVSAMYDRAAIAETSIKGRFDVNIAYYDEAMRRHLIQEQEISNEMTSALETGQFELWFQPQYNHSSGCLIGAEALVRWNHPRKGLIQPGIFIPVFEKNGFIYNMDKYVWEQACIFLNKHLASDSSPMPISVNISRHDIFQEDFYDYITSLVKKYKVPTHMLHLEITESAFAESTDQIISMVTRLKDYGFTIEIDDFGSGYSSLNTLKDVPANVLKLDMRFLENSGNSQKGGNILSSMVRMAKWLGMTVIAEGVESREQADYLKSIGCYYIQGYLYAKPMPAGEFEALLMKTDKEREIVVLETLDTLDNYTFWDPNSMDTLIFNSYVGGACIFEYSSGKIELLRANDKYAEVIGGKDLSVEDAISIPLVDCVYKDSLKIARRAIRNAIKTGLESTCELVLHSIHTMTRDIYLRCHMRVIARANERCLFYCTVENITAQREAEKNEREVSKMMETIMDNIHGGVTAVTIQDENTHFIFANDEYFRQLGYTREQFDAEVKSAFDLVHPDDREAVMEQTTKASLDGLPFTCVYRALRRDSKIIWLQSNISITTMTGVQGLVQLSVANDITAQKEIEQKALEISSQMEAILENVNGGISAATLIDRKVSYLFVNDKYYSMFGYTEEQFKNECPGGIADVMHPDDFVRVCETAESGVRDSVTRIIEFRVYKRDGSLIWVRSHSSVCYIDGIDSPVHIAVSNDITGEKESEAKIAETSEQIMFLNEISSSVLSTDDSTTAINEMLYKILEYFDGNRVYVFEFDYEKLTTNNTYEVCAHDSQPMIDMLQNISLDFVALWLNAFAEKNHICIDSVNTLDESRKAEREILQAQSIESLVAVPLRRDGILIGFMEVDDPCQNQSHVVHLEALGDYMAVMLTRRDLTAKIQGDNEMLKNLMNDTPGGFARIQFHPDETFTMVFANEGFCKLVDMTQEEVMATYGINAAWGIHPDDAKNALACAEKAVKETGILTIPCRLRRKNDEYIALTLFARLIKSPSGDLFFNVYYADMAEQGKLEAQRRELLDNLPCGAGIYKLEDGQLSVVYLNNRYRELVGRPLDDLDNTPVLSAVHPADREHLWDELLDAMSKGRDAVCDIRIIQGDGNYRPFRTVCRIVVQDENNAISYTTYTPISSDEMSFREMLPVALAAMMESSTDLSFVKDKNLNYICCSRTFAEMVGLENETNVVGKNDYDLFDTELAEQYRMDDYAVIQSGKSLVDYVERIPSNDGSLRYSSTSKHLLYDSLGNIIGLYGIGRDITESRETYAHLKLLTDNMPGGLALYALTSEGLSTTYLSDGVYKLIGYEKEEFNRLTDGDPLALVFEEDLPAVHNEISALRTGSTSVNCQYRIRTKDGGYRWFNLIGTPSPIEGDRININMVILDITEQKAKEEGLRNQEEMEERLRVSEEELKLAMSQIGKMVCVYDVSTMTLTMPKAYALKHNLPQIIPDTPAKQIQASIIDEATLPGFVAMFNDILDGKEKGSTDINIGCADGTRCWERGEFVTIFDRNGKPVKAIVAVEDVTVEYEKANESNKLREDEQIFRLVAAHSNRLIYNYDVATRSAKRYAFTKSAVYDLEELHNLPYSAVENGTILPESHKDFKQIFSDIHDGKPYGNTKIHVLINDNINWIDVQYSVILSDTNIPKSAVISLLNITEDHEKELAYDRYQQNINEDSSREGIIYFESDLTMDMVEKRGGHVLALDIPEGSHDGMVFYGINNLLPEESRNKGWAFFSREHLITAFNQGVRTLTEEWHTLYQGIRWRWYQAQIQLIQDPYSNHIRAYTVLRDITCEKTEALDMQRMGKIDGMTGLYNKTVTETLIQERLSRKDNTPCALLIADLDNLKAINDNLGHDQGDHAICIIADTLRSQFRETDIIGRVGGDEFVAFLDGCGNELKLHSLMSAFIKKLSFYRIGEDKNVAVSSSVGIVISETGTTTYEEMFKMADKAMYYVKNNGKNDYAIYTPDMEHAVYKYTGRNSVLTMKTNYFDDEELNCLLEAVSTIYPLVISVNLTQNSYYMLQYDKYMTKTCLDAGNFDELIAEGAPTFHEDDQTSFVEAFSRENLLAAHATGKFTISHKGRQMGDDGIYHYVRTDFIFVKDYAGNDIKGIALARELTLSHYESK